MLKTIGALAVALAVGVTAADAAPAGSAAEVKAKAKTAAAKPKICKTLVGEMVTFGEESTREGANNALDKEIAAWEAKYKVKAAPRDRKMECKDYIKLINEFECKVTATVCR